MQLDLSSLDKAISQIQESLSFANSPQAKADARLFLQFRAAAIKAFEYSYELSWKFMKRFIEFTGPSESQTDVTDFKELLRIAAEFGIIENVEAWIGYRDMRNITSHTYADDKAAKVYAIIPQFLTDAVYLRDQIRQKLKSKP